MDYKVHIGEQEFDLTKENSTNLNIVSNGDAFHVLKDNQAFDVKLITANFQSKTMTIEVNGNKYDVKIEDEYDLLVKKMGLSLVTSQKMQNVKAPMPGLIVEVLAEVGQTIEKGTPLLILEAMKMENVLKAEGEGVVKSIEITKGNAVDKGQILIEML